MIDVDEDGILNLMEAQHVLKCLGFKGFDAESVNIIVWVGLVVSEESGAKRGQMKDFWYRNCCSKRIFLKNHYFVR